MMELIEGKKAKEDKIFPKNVRQIGEPGEGKKVFIEDYAYTFLRQFAEENLTCVRTAILIGKVDESGVYIQGAMEMDMGQDTKNWFTHDHWRNIFQEVQGWFEGWEVVGWYMANPGFPAVLTDELQNLHMRNFAAADYVFFQMDIVDSEEVFYISTGNGMVPLCGYYIYYEKNECMQTYISQRKGGVGIEPEGILKDRAAARFRNVMQEKKEQGSQKKVMAFLYTACTFLVMVILVIGITMVNNYDRMSDMESAIYQISESLDGEGGRLQQEVPAEEKTPEEPSEQEEAILSEEQELVEAAVEEENHQKPEEEQEQEEQPEEEQPEEEQPEEEQPEEEIQPVMSQAVEQPEPYQIQKGDTLLEISRIRYGTENMVKKICEINALEDGDKIYVGQTILLP